MKKSQTYISIDVESDGPIPGPNSMLSLGAAALDRAGNILSTFEVNLDTMVGAEGDPETMNWWKTQPEAWEACRRGPLRSPQSGMASFVRWVNGYENPVCVAYPAGYDFMFVYWYLMRFVGKSPFSFSAIDIKTVAWTVMGGSYRNATKKNFPRHWIPKSKHTHVAVDDAVEQGLLFINILRDLEKAGWSVEGVSGLG